MNQNFEKAKQWFEQLVTRERWLVLGCAAVIVALILDTALVSPATKTAKRKQAELAAAAENLEETRQQLNLLSTAEGGSPLAGKAAEENALEQQIARLKSDLEALSAGLISASTLPRIMEEMLIQTGELELLEMTVDPPAQETDELFRHSVSVKLSGGFTALISYLEALENLQWKFYWDELNYRVQQYPNAEIELKVYTLSNHKAAI